ncbi:MAG: hypothetical protein ACOY3I_08855 [Verrucomicrobiota bacterium]
MPKKTLKKLGKTPEVFCDAPVSGLAETAIFHGAIADPPACAAASQYDIEQERAVDVQRLEGLIARWYPIATASHLILACVDRKGSEVLKEDSFEAGAKAVMLVLRILERRSRLLGLDLTLSHTPIPENTHEIPLEKLAEQIQGISIKDSVLNNPAY